MVSQVTKISATFAPIEQSAAVEKVMLSIVALGFSLASGSAFNSLFKQMPYFKTNSNELGILKDSVNGIVTAGVNIAKDLGIKDKALAQASSLESYVSAIVDIWFRAVNDLVRQPGGEHAHRSSLLTLI